MPSKAAALLTTLFGLVGLVLAAVGLYGVLSYAITQRSRELGLRMALAAHRRTIRWVILRQGTTLVGVELAVGMLSAMGVTGLLQGLLFGISQTDPMTFGGIAILLMTVAVAASAVPGVRATRADPVEALRHE